MERTEELEDQVRSLTRTVEEMRARLEAVESGEPKHENGSRPSSRRNFLRLGAAAALGAVGMAASKVLPAAAANGGNLILGQANSATLPTTVAAGGVATPVQVFAAQDNQFVPADLATAGGFQGTLQGLGNGNVGLTDPTVEGVDGWAQGARAFGVYGLTDKGTGVTGESATGIGLYARRSGRIRQDGLIAAGATPGYLPNDFEMVRDVNGVMWISQAGGTWKRVATNDLNLFPDPRRLYAGNFQTTAPGTFLIDATIKVLPSNGLPNGPSGVPAGAQAAFCAVQSYSAGVMTLYPDGAADPGLANWSSTANGPLNLTYVFVPLSAAGKFRMHTYFTGQKYIDAWGFVL